MSPYHRTSVIFDEETTLTPGAHVSDLSGRVIGSIDIGSGKDDVVIMPHTIADLDRLVAALGELRASWLRLEAVQAIGQPSLIDDLEMMAAS